VRVLRTAPVARFVATTSVFAAGPDSAVTCPRRFEPADCANAFGAPNIIKQLATAVASTALWLTLRDMIPPCVFHCRHPSKLFAYGKVKRGLAPHGSICCAEATDLSGGVRSCAHFVVTTRRECVRVSDATHAQRQGGFNR